MDKTVCNDNYASKKVTSSSESDSRTGIVSRVFSNSILSERTEPSILVSHADEVLLKYNLLASEGEEIFFAQDSCAPHMTDGDMPEHSLALNGCMLLPCSAANI